MMADNDNVVRKFKQKIPQDMVSRVTYAMSAWGVEQMGASPFDTQAPFQKKATFEMVRHGLDSLTGDDFRMLLDRVEGST